MQVRNDHEREPIHVIGKAQYSAVTGQWQVEQQQQRQQKSTSRSQTIHTHYTDKSQSTGQYSNSTVQYSTVTDSQYSTVQ